MCQRRPWSLANTRRAKTVTPVDTLLPDSLQVVALLTTPVTTDFTTVPVDRVELDLGGIPGDRHHGLTRLSDSRERHLPRGTVIRNRRVSCPPCRSPNAPRSRSRSRSRTSMSAASAPT